MTEHNNSVYDIIINGCMHLNSYLLKGKTLNENKQHTYGKIKNEEEKKEIECIRQTAFCFMLKMHRMHT